MILASPTEPLTVLTSLAKLGADYVTHSAPEQLGADYLLCTPSGTVGVQRKVVPGDFFSSVEDGRLANGLIRLARLDVPILLLEGEFLWSADGRLLDRHYGRFTRLQVRNLLRTVQLQGIQVEFTDGPQDTALALTEMATFYSKPDHSLLLRRPKNLPKTAWGTATDPDYQLFLLQGLPMVGPTLARNIIAHFGGIPWAWTCSPEELAAVNGLGKGTVEKIYHALAYRLSDGQLTSADEVIAASRKPKTAKPKTAKPKPPAQPKAKRAQAKAAQVSAPAAAEPKPAKRSRKPAPAP